MGNREREEDKREGNSGDNERWKTEKGKVIMRGAKQRKGR